jgi:hypothetical protein
VLCKALVGKRLTYRGPTCAPFRGGGSLGSFYCRFGANPRENAGIPECSVNKGRKNFVIGDSFPPLGLLYQRRSRNKCAARPLATSAPGYFHSDAVWIAWTAGRFLVLMHVSVRPHINLVVDSVLD